MVNSVIVTLIDFKGNELFDVELPCNIVISDLKKQMRYINELKPLGLNYYLSVNGKRLNDETSLSENGVWDGTYINIEMG